MEDGILAIGDVIVGMDIGTSKVSVVIGEVNNFNQIEIICNASRKCSGIKKNKIISEDEIVRSITNVIGDVEAETGLRINSSYVTISGKYVTIVQNSVTTEDLSNYIIISHADPYVPSLPAHDLQKEDMGYNNERHIFVYERASQLELLSKVKNTCMFVSPMPKHLLNIYGLKEIKCSDKVGMYKDVLIYRKKQKLDSFDELFINELENSIKEH